MPKRYLSNVSFLVVDDNAFMRAIVRRVLSTLDVAAIEDAADGEAAIMVMKHFTPDIAIVDWEMQPMNGLELIKHIRTSADSPNPFLPIIMLSAYSEMSHVLEARDAGVNEFVVKPISVNSLFSRIEAVIERPRPFVRLPDFFGPDRRRKEARHDVERRKEDQGEISMMSQDDVNALFNPKEGEGEAAKDGDGKAPADSDGADTTDGAEAATEEPAT